jgi:hypothetical protein
MVSMGVYTLYQCLHDESAFADGYGPPIMHSTSHNSHAYSPRFASMISNMAGGDHHSYILHMLVKGRLPLGKFGVQSSLPFAL